MSQPLPAVWHDDIDSTSEEAKRIAARGRFTEHWIAARAQTAGRGRLGRSWKSPPGNLFASALLAVPGGLAMATRLPFAAALAVHDVVAAVAPYADVRLKWPNDVRVGGAKLSGILIESGETEGQVWAVVGIGINVAEAPEGTGQPATCLAELSPATPINVDHALDALRKSFATRWQEARETFGDTRAAWCARAELGVMRAQPGGEPVEGEFDGLEPDGGLRLRLHSGERATIRAGDVELVRKV